MARLKDKVTIAQQEKYLTYGMVLFGDLDWPLDTSRRYVSISWLLRSVPSSDEGEQISLKIYT